MYHLNVPHTLIINMSAIFKLNWSAIITQWQIGNGLKCVIHSLKGIETHQNSRLHLISF